MTPLAISFSWFNSIGVVFLFVVGLLVISSIYAFGNPLLGLLPGITLTIYGALEGYLASWILWTMTLIIVTAFGYRFLVPLILTGTNTSSGG